jgi:hypothetical protein
MTDEIIYVYNRQNLLISYGAAAFVSLLAIVAGFYAIHENGVVHSTTFSSLIATTRNPTLDHIFESESLGALPMPKEILRHKVRFGLLSSKFPSVKSGVEQEGGGEGG